MSGMEGKTEEQKQAFAESAKNTQFGGENANPSYHENGGNAPWSVRKSTQHLARSGRIAKDGTILLPRIPTPAQKVAAALLETAMDKHSKDFIRAAEFVTDQVDGKLAQVNINTDLKQFEEMTEEELLEHNRKLDERIAAASARHDAGGDAAPQGDGGSAAGEGQGADEGAATAGSDQPIG